MVVNKVTNNDHDALTAALDTHSGFTHQMELHRAHLKIRIQ